MIQNHNQSKFKSVLKSKKIQGLALDIDETISYTLKYWGEYLITNHGNPENLTIDEIYLKYGYVNNYWKTDEAITWMNNAIHDDKLHEKFEVIQDADEIVQEVNNIKPIVIYITNRPESVKNGTVKWLSKHQFPNAPIFFKPDKINFGSGGSWKGDLLKDLYPGVEGFIDDSPHLLEEISPDYKGTIYYSAHDTSPRNDIKVIPCKTWKDVLKVIREKSTKKQ